VPVCGKPCKQPRSTGTSITVSVPPPPTAFLAPCCPPHSVHGGGMSAMPFVASPFSTRNSPQLITTVLKHQLSSPYFFDMLRSSSPLVPFCFASTMRVRSHPYRDHGLPITAAKDTPTVRMLQQSRMASTSGRDEFVSNKTTRHLACCCLRWSIAHSSSAFTVHAMPPTVS